VAHRLIFADVLDGLQQIEAGSVQCIVTSPPYWNLRDYGTTGQLGLEPTIKEYVEKMVAVFRECKRVLRDDGTLWLNLGDSYASSGACDTFSGKQATNKGSFKPGRKPTDNLKHKGLCGIPWRVAIALQDDGWYLRSDVIWAKPNPMPESVTDRPTSAHEHIFLLTKSARYFYDADAIREPAKEYGGISPKFGGNKADGYGNATYSGNEWRPHKNLDPKGQSAHSMHKNRAAGLGEPETPANGANCRNVWTIPTQPYSGSHYAVFPPEIPRRCILAGSRAGDTVLDPFMGSGTTAEVAITLGRNVIGIDLDERNRKLIEQRILSTTPPLEGIA
jgi:DNA modification methylase